MRREWETLPIVPVALDSNAACWGINGLDLEGEPSRGGRSRVVTARVWRAMIRGSPAAARIEVTRWSRRLPVFVGPLRDQPWLRLPVGSLKSER